MATSTRQRVGIWIIAAAMILGTLAGFIAMILAPQNETADQAQLQSAYEEYSKAMTAYQEKVDAQAAKLSNKYYGDFSKYKDKPESFAANEINKLEIKDLENGTGKEVKDATTFSAYYIGWDPKGSVFDQSIDGKSLKAPLLIEGLKNASLIEGWKEGMIGMKIGGVRLLEIPADKAYGEAGRGDDIGPDTPLKFIVMAISPAEKIPEPTIPQELLR